jgi:hypothetical protein
MRNQSVVEMRKQSHVIALQNLLNSDRTGPRLPQTSRTLDGPQTKPPESIAGDLVPNRIVVRRVRLFTFDKMVVARFLGINNRRAAPDPYQLLMKWTDL